MTLTDWLNDTWQEIGGKNCPPTQEDLAAGLPECPETPRSEADTRLHQTMGSIPWAFGTLTVINPGEPAPDPPAPPASAEMAWTWQADDGVLAASGTGPFSARVPVALVHKIWTEARKRNSDLPHPLAPLVKAWQDRAKPVAVNRTKKGIVPASFVRRHKQADLALPGPGPLDNLPGLVPAPPEARQPALLPELDPGREQPALLALFDAAGGRSGKQRGIAPVEMRIFIEALMSVPVGARNGGLYRVESPLTGRPFTIEEIVGDWLQWKVKSYDTRFRHNLNRALHSLRDLEVPMGKHGGWYYPLLLHAVEGMGLHHRVSFLASLPKGSHVGPSVDRHVLRVLGKRSEPAYRAYLALCFDWDRYGGHNGKLILPSRPVAKRDREGYLLNANDDLITGKGGVLVKSPYDKRAIRTGKREPNPARTRYPEYYPDDLVRLCFPEKAIAKAGTAARRVQQQRAKAAIDMIRQADGCTIEGRRIMPPDSVEGDPLLRKG